VRCCVVSLPTVEPPRGGIGSGAGDGAALPAAVARGNKGGGGGARERTGGADRTERPSRRGGGRGMSMKDASESSLLLPGWYDVLGGGDVPRPVEAPPNADGGAGVTADEGAEDIRSRCREDATRDAGREGGCGDGPEPRVIVRAKETDTVASAAISAARPGERGVVVNTT
jgi:hypothetical protein